MIFVTGDTHRETDWAKIFDIAREGLLTENDYIIIAGDFGGIWTGTDSDNDVLLRYKRLPCKVLFIDGNHENFDALYTYPVEEWNGGKVHKIAENIYHLMRGQVFTIEGKKFFTLGGGTSIDKNYRLKYELVHGQKVWWEQENPTQDELITATKSLLKYDNKVDFILTHTISKSFMQNTLQFVKEESALCDYLDYIMNHVAYTRWFCGHFHVDKDYDEQKVSMLYNSVYCIATNK